MSATTSPPAWTLEGSVFVACNCDYGCPCNVNGRPTLGHCEGGWTVPYEVELVGDRSRYRIGDVAELELEPIRNPVTGAEVHPRLILPEGLIGKDLGLFASRVFRVADGVAYDHSGRYGALGQFVYAGP